MKLANIAVVNAAKSKLPFDMHDLVRACQKQVSRDFAPLWGLDCNLFLVPNYTDDYPILILLDDADQANALGYHEVTAKGWPIGKTFVRTTLKYGGNPSVTFSHELLEMLANPKITNFASNPMNGWTYIVETADAVQAEEYEIDGIKVSNFVTPAYFQADAPRGTKFDFLGVLSAPFSLAHGGYMPVNKNDGRGWTQVFASHAAQQSYMRTEHHRTPLIVNSFNGGNMDPIELARMEPQLQSRAAALGINWGDISNAVAYFGPDLVVLIEKGLSNGWFTKDWILQAVQMVMKWITTNNIPPQAALLPGIKASIGNTIMQAVLNLFLSQIKNIDWSAVIQQVLSNIMSNIGKPNAPALQQAP